MKLTGSAPTGYSDGAVTTDPSGKFLYVANVEDGNISAFSIDWTTGALTPIAGSPFATGTDPTVFATSNNFLYLFGGNFFDVPTSFSGYAINTLTGALTPVPGSPFWGNGSPANYIAVDAVHSALYQPAFSTQHSGNGFNINTIDPATGTVTFAGLTAEYQEQGAETTRVDFSGNYLYTVDLWDGTENSPTAVGSFAIDPVTGQLSPLGTHYETASHTLWVALAVER